MDEGKQREINSVKRKLYKIKKTIEQTERVNVVSKCGQ